MTDQGVMIRFNIATVSQTGRATLGVRLIRLDDGGKVATMAKVDPEPEVDPEAVTDESADVTATDDATTTDTVVADVATEEPDTNTED